MSAAWAASATDAHAASSAVICPPSSPLSKGGCLTSSIPAAPRAVVVSFTPRNVATPSLHTQQHYPLLGALAVHPSVHTATPWYFGRSVATYPMAPQRRPPGDYGKPALPTGRTHVRWVYAGKTRLDDR